MLAGIPFSSRYHHMSVSTKTRGRISPCVSGASARKPNLFPAALIQMKRLIKAIVNHRHPDKRIARGNPSAQLLYPHFTHAECSLLHRLRTGRTLTDQVLDCFGRARHSTYAFCSVTEGIPPLLQVHPTYAKERLKRISTLRSAGRPNSSTEDLSLPFGSA